MPILQRAAHVKTDIYGTRKYDMYTVTIPYKIATSSGLAGGMRMILYGVALPASGSVRLHKEPPQDNKRDVAEIPVRSIQTKRYRGQTYYSTSVTLPIRFVKALSLQKGDMLDVMQSGKAIAIRLPKKQYNERKAATQQPQQ